MLVTSYTHGVAKEASNFLCRAVAMVAPDHFSRQQSNILEFGGAPCRPVGSHVATADRLGRVEIDGCK